MSDLISRADAIDALMAWEEDSVWDEECLKHRGEPFWISPSNVVENLPSAESEIIRCKDCKHRQEDECPMYHVEWVEYDDDGYIDSYDVIYDYTEDDGYCHMAERRTDE